MFVRSETHTRFTWKAINVESERTIVVESTSDVQALVSFGEIKEKYYPQPDYIWKLVDIKRWIA